MKLKTIYTLLPEEYRRHATGIAGAVLLRALLDFAGVATLLSVLLLLLSNNTYRPYVLPTALAGVTFMALKNLFVIALERRQSRYLLSLYRYFSGQLLDSFYRRGLLYIRQRGPATLTHEVNYVCYTFVLQVLGPLIRMAGETVLLAMLTIALYLYSPLMAAGLTFCFGIIAYGYMRFVRTRLTRYGEQENCAKQQQWRAAEELFRGYTEVASYQAYKTLHNRFARGLSDISHNREQIETLSRLPGALIETGMAAALLVLVFTSDNEESVKITMGVFGVAAFRILPGVRSLLNGWIQIHNNRFAVEVLTTAFRECPPQTTDRDNNEMTFCKEIKAEGLSFAYPQSEKIIDRLSFHIARGERVGIQGVSGIGKTTLLNLLLGFFAPDKGNIYIDGLPLTPANREAWQRKTAYVPQEVFILEGTIEENVALGTPFGRADHERILNVLARTGLLEWVQSLPDGTASLLGENGCRISGGQKQRIGIARALYKGAEVLFLDEATSALDRQTEEEIIQMLRQLTDAQPELTLLMIAHHPSALQICDRIIHLKTNKI